MKGFRGSQIVFVYFFDEFVDKQGSIKGARSWEEGEVTRGWKSSEQKRFLEDVVWIVSLLQWYQLGT